MSGLFDKHLHLLARSLDFRAQRNNLLASNVANVETPGYKAKDLVFERELGRAMRAREPGPLRVTHAKHLDGRNIVPLALVKPSLIQSATPTTSLDGNTVDLEKEMAKVGENQLSYQALTQMVAHKFSLLKAAIRGDGI